MSNLLKRKSPYSAAGSPAPNSRAASAGASVKSEIDRKPRGLGGTPSGSHYGFMDPRTVSLELRDYLKDRSTLRWQDAYLHVEDKSPGVDPNQVLEMLKGLDRVKFNEHNQVFTYEPEIVLRTQADLKRHIKTHCRPTQGLTYKSIREAMPGPELVGYMEELEKEGSVLILRSLTGKLKDAPLPALGKENAWGDKLNGGGPERWRTIFWDELKERGRAADRVDDEFVFAWDDVKIQESDDVAKLLEGQDLKASSVDKSENKPKAEEQGKKKKKRNRALKITNTHMKAFGIDFSQDYEAPS